MAWHAKSTSTALATILLLATTGRGQPAQERDLNDLQEQTVKAAIKRVAPSVVQIETAMGAETIMPTKPRGQEVRKGTGPTTGIAVSPDGYVLTSAFNFANKPQKIFVSVPGHRDRYIAQIHATDQSRMLTLLKLENFQSTLIVPAAAPRKDVAIGQSVIALGRTLDPSPDHMPSISLGIISALERIWGRAFQTDAKVSPANYGGPLVDLQGRVIGILVPASPLSEDETAGVEWYDAGIGFAIPLEDINAVLPRLLKKEDLHRGLLGITPKSGDLYGEAPVVASILPGSAAEKAGIKAGDTILEIDGHPVTRQAQVMHLLGPKYDGDLVKVKVKHADGKEETYEKVKLTANTQVLARAWLGILPMRDDPELGVEVRYVFEKSPAEIAGIKAGDRITKIGVGEGPLAAFTGQVPGREQLATVLASVPAKTVLKLELKRKEGGKTETVTATLSDWSDDIPEKLPPEASVKKALAPLKKAGPPMPMPEEKKLDDNLPGGKRPEGRRPGATRPDEKQEQPEKKKDEKPEQGFFKRQSAAGDHTYWVYVPDEKKYDANRSYALLVWLHPVGKGKEREIKEIAEFWMPYCDQTQMILLCPQSENETGWVAGESDFLREMIQDTIDRYTIDKRRVIMHGMGVGGQMAFYMGFHARDLIRAVATTGSVLANQPKPQEPARPLAFFLSTGDRDPLVADVKESREKLAGLKYPIVFREIAEMGHQYLSDDHAAEVLEELVRWIDSLDRM